MRVLITGVGGFLGRRLAAALLDRGHEVVGTVLADELLELPGVECEALDVQDRAAVTELIARRNPHSVVHFAALSHVGSSWTRIPEHFRINVLGTEAVLDACPGRRVLFASSAEVYGVVDPPDLPIREDQPLAPANPYAFGKAAAERLVRRAGGVVVRCFNVVGPGQAATFALPTFASQLARIGMGLAPPVLRVGNLDAIRDFVHVDDAISGFVVALEQGPAGAVFNLASGEGTRLADVLARMIALAGLEVAIEVDPERLRPAEAPRLEGSAAQLEALGWLRRHTLDEALAALLAEARDRIQATPEVHS